MVRIRLRRMGAKKKPFYRIVVADKRSPRDGRFIETIGTYNPLTEPETVSLEHERAAHWLSVGAQPSDAVARILRNAKLLDESGKPLPFDPSNYKVEEAVPATPAVDEPIPAEPTAEQPPTEASTDAGVSDAEEIVAEASDTAETLTDDAVDTASDAVSEAVESVTDAAEETADETPKDEE